MLGPVRAAQLRRAKWWRLNNIDGEVIAWCITIAIWGAAVIDTHVFKPGVVEYITPQTAEAHVEPREVRIEVRVDWTKERIKKEIETVFPGLPIMLEVARCESEYRVKAYNPTNNSNDKGIFQISERYHGDRVEQLGLDMYNPAENIRFARMLYDERGLDPWIHSKHCWG